MGMYRKPAVTRIRGCLSSQSMHTDVMLTLDTIIARQAVVSAWCLDTDVL